MASAPVGGSNRTFLWLDNAGTASTLAFTFNKNESSNINGSPLINQIELELANKIRNEAYWEFLKDYLVKVNMTLSEQVYEDGSVDSVVNIPSTATKFHVAHLDGVIDGKIAVTYFRGVLAPDTGSSTRSSGSLGDTPVKIVGIPASQTMTLESTTLWTAASDLFRYSTDLADITFVTGAYGCIAMFQAK